VCRAKIMSISCLPPASRPSSELTWLYASGKAGAPVSSRLGERWQSPQYSGQRSSWGALATVITLPLAVRKYYRAAQRAQGKRSVTMEASELPYFTRLGRSLSFYSAIIPVLGQYQWRPWLRSLGLEDKDGQDLMQDMDEWGATTLQETLVKLGGFYVKSGQVLSTRVDLFSEAYTKRLSVLQDSLPPVPFPDVKKIVTEDLCGGNPLKEIFREFDTRPCGTASIAQVHRAVLNDGREVAVKVLRPNCEPVLRGDIANLKGFAKAMKGRLPVDYFPVFCELERALDGELDMMSEGQSARKIAASISHDPWGNECDPPVQVPLPLPGLSSRRVLVMEFIRGSPLSQLDERAKDMGLDLDGPLGKMLGQRILESLTTAYGRMIFSSGFIHGDPHPGNIFVTETGEIALIDCGQVAQLYRDQRLLVAEAILRAANYDGSPEANRNLAEVVSEFGVTFSADTINRDAAGASVALYLFGDPSVPFPGGYSREEFSPKSPLKALKTFPTELVLLGRASVLIKGVAAKLGLEWNVAKKWESMAEACLVTLCGETGCSLPAWALTSASGPLDGKAGGRLRFHQAARKCSRLIAQWGFEKFSAMVPARRKMKSSFENQ